MNRLSIEVQANISKIQPGMVSYQRLATAKATASPGPNMVKKGNNVRAKWELELGQTQPLADQSEKDKEWC